MRLKRNDDKMTMYHQATVRGYHNIVLFIKNSIANIIAPRNLRLQYLVTYMRDEMMFVVHRESEGKPNMQFIDNESDLHYFDPRDQEFAFLKHHF